MSIDVNINSRSINVSICRIGGNGIRPVEDIDITPGEPTVIDTGQSSVKPRFIVLYNEDGKRIDKNMPEPTVSLDTNYIVTYPSQLLTFENVTMYYQ